MLIIAAFPAVLGCHLARFGPSSSTSGVAQFQPSNVFKSTNKLPAEYKRLALLPLAGSTETSTAEFGRDTLEIGAAGRTAKRPTGHFEVIALTPEQLGTLDRPRTVGPRQIVCRWISLRICAKKTGLRRGFVQSIDAISAVWDAGDRLASDDDRQPWTAANALGVG